MSTIPDYNDLKVTTITSVVKIMGNVDAAVAFQLLPITRVDIKQTRIATKCKLPHLKDSPGAILSARYRKHTRGVIKNKKNPFKNSVTMDICLKDKNVGIKLSNETLHICGGKKEAHAKETTDILFGHLTHIQNMLELLQKKNTEEIISFVKKISKGPKLIRKESRHIYGRNVTVIVTNNFEENALVSHYNCEESKEIYDRELVQFLLSFTEDFLYHSDFCKKLDYIKKIKRVYTDTLSFLNYSEAMVNYNYSLGYKINRENLEKFMSHKNGFYSRHNNELSNSVTVELPYEPSCTTNIKKKKNKVPHHSFLVYKSGSVTQSGPGIKEMENVYYLFMKTIEEIKSHIYQ